MDISRKAVQTYRKAHYVSTKRNLCIYVKELIYSHIYYIKNKVNAYFYALKCGLLPD